MSTHTVGLESPLVLKKGKKKGKSESQSFRAGLVFPVGRLKRYLRSGRYARRVSAAAPVYLGGVLEYITAEVLELAGNAARDNKRQRITARHLLLAVKNDTELDAMTNRACFAQGGVVPHIHTALLPPPKKKQSQVKRAK